MLDRRGVIAAVLAYSAWGFFPLYWQLLKRVSALETMSHRVIWSLAFYAAIAAVQTRMGLVSKGLFRQYLCDPKYLKTISIASGFIAFNWLLYVWAVTHGHVMETSLGYFINPLINVAIGSLVFKERLLPLQKLSLAFAFFGVVWLAFDYGHPPWIALGLAVSFAIYGVMKKTIPGQAIVLSMVETTVLLPFALFGAIAIRLLAGDAAAAGVPTSDVLGADVLASTVTVDAVLGSLIQTPIQLTVFEWVLIIGGGAITGIPLLFFGIAAQRLPFSILGFFQYLAPTFQFLSAVFFFHEPLDASRLAGFSLIWIALGIFLYHLKREQSRPTALPKK